MLGDYLIKIETGMSGSLPCGWCGNNC